MLTQVELIRGRSLQLLRNLHIYISCLPVREQAALEKLSGVEGQKTFARITDFILCELGHSAPEAPEHERKSYRASKAYTPTLTLNKNNAPQQETKVV